jgi:hypothetical protein
MIVGMVSSRSHWFISIPNYPNYYRIYHAAEYDEITWAKLRSYLLDFKIWIFGLLFFVCKFYGIEHLDLSHTRSQGATVPSYVRFDYSILI